MKLKVDKKCKWSGSIRTNGSISLLTNNKYDSFEIGLIHRWDGRYEWISFPFIEFTSGDELESGICNSVKEAKILLVESLKKNNVIE